jgi:hypothetical protein
MKYMPARPSHLPTTAERSTLQKLYGGRALSLYKLHPAGKKTIGKLMIKGWVALDKSELPVTVRITPAGEEALKAKIPDAPKRIRPAVKKLSHANG